ncbi:LamG domain-containing protein [Candidatus Saccharibacteria bacterium]|nr:LamG domain-containing protein [Candidatus Saccharibacteria bacterium]
MLRWWKQLAIGFAVVLLPAAASADLLQSTHFRLNPDTADTFGGIGSSAHYGLTDAGGETAVGAGSSSSYKLGQGYVASLPQSIQLSVLPSGTYAYWPMDTGSGSQAYDVSLNNDQATLVNAPTWTTGIVGQGILLNGTSQYLYTSNAITAPTSYSLEFWFKTTTTSGGRLFGFGNNQTGASGTSDRGVYMTNSGNLSYGVTNGTNKTVTTAAGYNDGSWHFVAATLGASGLLLYVDGVKQGSDTTTTTAGTYTGYWRFGYDSLSGWPGTVTSNYFAGTLDEARVVSRQLGNSEVANDYTAGANALRGAFTIPNITPGTSQTYNVDAVVRTDAGGYDLSIQKPQPFLHTDGTTVLPDISGTISSPIAWLEGTTKGLGFGVVSGTNVEGKWGTSPNFTYAAVPSSATIYHSRSGLSGATPETTTIQYRVDTSSSQKQGTYATQIIYTATLKP